MNTIVAEDVFAVVAFEVGLQQFLDKAFIACFFAEPCLVWWSLFEFRTAKIKRSINRFDIALLLKSHIAILLCWGEYNRRNLPNH